MSTKFYTSIFLMLSIALFGCQEQPQENETISEETPASTEMKDAELSKLNTKPGESSGYVLDANNSIVEWQGTKTIGTGKHIGTLNFLAGKMVVKDGSIVEGEFRIDMKSLHTTDYEKGSDMYKKLVGHLKSEDFFNVDKYPVSTFRIKSFEPLKKANSDFNYTVKGDLTIKDVTETIFFPAKVEVENGKIVVTASPVIDRTTWNVKYGSDKFFDLAKDKVISDNMQINILVKTL